MMAPFIIDFHEDSFNPHLILGDFGIHSIYFAFIIIIIVTIIIIITIIIFTIILML